MENQRSDPSSLEASGTAGGRAPDRRPAAPSRWLQIREAIRETLSLSAAAQTRHLRLAPTLYAIGILASVAMGLLLREVLRSERALALERVAAGIQSRLADRVLLYENSLLQLRAFAHTIAKGYRTRDLPEFEAGLADYVQRLETFRSYPANPGLVFAPRVRRAELGEHARAYRTQYGPLYRVWPGASREDFYPITRVASGERATLAAVPAIGYDIASDGVRRTALFAAIRSGEVVGTAPFRFATRSETDAGEYLGFALFVAIYRGGRVPSSPEERFAAHEGLLYTAFHLRDFFAETVPAPLNPPAERYRVLAPGAGAGDPATLLYDSGDGDPTAGEAPATPAYEAKLEMPGGGPPLFLRVYAAPTGWTAPETYFPALIAAVGLLLSYFIYRGLRAREEMRESLERAVHLRTRQLSELLDEQQNLNSNLVALNEDLEAFSYSVSHDLRTPLRGIDGFSRAIEEDFAGRLDPRGLRYLDFIRQGTQRAGRIIDDILRLSYLSRATLRRETADLGAIAREVIDGLRALEPARKVEFRVEGETRALCDGELMRIALENLLGNAWKFTAPRPHARIVFRGDGSDATEWKFTVEDNGVGFKPEYVGRLFGVFQRLHSEKEFKGSGIGLATVRRILAKHGGRVWAQARDGEGAEFGFALPKT